MRRSRSLRYFEGCCAVSILISSMVIGNLPLTSGFGVCLQNHRFPTRQTRLEMSSDNHSNEEEEEAILRPDLAWRLEKVRLEERNKQRFLKAGPRHLRYEEARKWVIAFNRWDSEQEWNDWIAMGEKRNAYIPNRPDEYYQKQGKWISWDHFLGKTTHKSQVTTTADTLTGIEDGPAAWL